MDVPFFQSKKIAPGTWQILSDGDYSYLVEGKRKRMVVDSGYGCGNLRAYCQSLTDRPVKQVPIPHDRFDHTANNSCTIVPVCEDKKNWRQFRFLALKKSVSQDLIGTGD